MNNVISALTARTQFGQILKRASGRDARKDFIQNVAPSPAAYEAIRREAKRQGTSLMSMREIDREIAAARRERRTKRSPKQIGA